MYVGVAILGQETWLFINSFAPWLAAAGTVAAVITSLYLSRRGDRISLKLSVGIRELVVSKEGSGHTTDVLWFNVTNLGRRSATLTQLYWKTNPLRKPGFVWVAPRNSYSSEFPVTLKDGDTANYVMPLDEFENNVAPYMKKKLSGRWGRLKSWLVFAYVATSTGDVFCKRPEVELRQRLLELARASGSDQSDTEG